MCWAGDGLVSEEADGEGECEGEGEGGRELDVGFLKAGVLVEADSDMPPCAVAGR